MSALVSLRDDILLAAARAMPLEADMTLAAPSSNDAQDFPARMQRLIEYAGGTGALARRCGVTARTVRNWCQGRSDISRERCLVLAHAMHISPLWLISGEGCMTAAAPAPLAGQHTGVDAGRLAAALQVLQSYVQLVGGSLSTAQRAEAIVELYGLLAPPGPADASRLIAFHRRLAAQLRGNTQALIA